MNGSPLLPPRLRNLWLLLIFCLQWPCAAQETGNIIVQTHSMRIELTPAGGAPAAWSIIDPDYVGDSGQPVTLLDQRKSSGSLALIDWEGEGLTGFFARADYATTTSTAEGATVVDFVSPVGPQNLQLRKTYVFPATGFGARLVLSWTNHGEGRLTIGGAEAGVGLKLGPGFGSAPAEGGGWAGSYYEYVQPVVADSVTKIATPVIDSGVIAEPLAWIGLHDRYFLVTASPAAGEPLIQAATSPTLDSITGQLPPLELEAGQTQSREFSIYAGPKQTQALRDASVGAEALLFGGLWEWMRWLCFALLRALEWIHEIVPNWGLAIIMLAILVRIAIFPIAHRGLRSQAKMNADMVRLKPRIDEIKKRWPKDAMRQHEETMKLYKEEGVSPYAPMMGCLWVLLQLPIFIALFNVIGQAYALRGAGFLWIEDLSQPDRLFMLPVSIPILGGSFNLLPVLMALSQAGSIALTSGAMGSAAQRRTMLMVTLVFLVLFYSFPAGLVLYWLCSNLLQWGHQTMIKPVKAAK